MLVKVTLARLLIREMADSQFVTLQEEGGDRMFPIAIGLPEAFAIERRLRKTAIPRPQTHDLLDQVIETMGGNLVQIVIHALDEGTFFAKLVIRQGADMVEVDSRPSDAIALGVRYDVPIFVEESVLDEASSEPTIDQTPPEHPGWMPDFDDGDGEDEPEDGFA
ncbi:MAG: hypothetical protein CMJ52_06715 [Planctomycetaceae bacterium]|nr:hypothetical protein [Planctomycetaceae bacterium]